jgi:hypothetical protein
MKLHNRSLSLLIVGFLLGILWTSGQAGASPAPRLPEGQTEEIEAFGS